MDETKNPWTALSRATMYENEWIRVNHHEVLGLNMDLSNSVTDERCTAFLAWELSEAPAQPDETELLEVARVPFWEAVGRVQRGEIRDAISVASLLRVALMALQNELPEQIAKVLGLNRAAD